MSFAFLLLGKTTVAFYDATAATRVSTETPSGGALGALENVGDALGITTPEVEPIFALDVSLNENHSLQSDITDHPVETGSDITDNIRNRPRVLTIQGMVTDTPSGILALAIVPGLVDRFATVPRSIEIFQEIERNWVNKKIFDVVTGLKVYQNMAVQSVTIPRSAQFARGLEFNIQLKQIEFVTSLTVAAGSLDGGDPDVNLGSQVGSPV